MDPAQEHGRRVLSPTDGAVHQNEHPGQQQRGIRSYGRDARDGAGAGDGDERGGERVLLLAVVALTHIVYHVGGEDADDGAAGPGLGLGTDWTVGEVEVEVRMSARWVVGRV